MDNKAFDSKRIALGYANDRPWLHKEVIHMIPQDLQRQENFENGLDVGCGAGLSTKALKLICDKVTGIDISDEMVEVCKTLYPEPEYSFFTSSAEEIRLSEQMENISGTYDIVTAAGVVNWVDEKVFLRRLSEVMKNNGILCIYDFWITDRMMDIEAYTKWWHEEYLARYPKPVRKENVWTDAEMSAGFHIEEQKEIRMRYEFTKDAFIRFMMIQSNVNEKIRQGLETEEEAEKWFAESLEEIFADKSRYLEFAGYIWYIRLKKQVMD